MEVLVWSEREKNREIGWKFVKHSEKREALGSAWEREMVSQEGGGEAMHGR